jgi:hypothetical protein
MRQVLVVMLSMVIAVVCVPNTSEAMRDYLLSQGYKTAHRGEIEIEMFNDWVLHEFDNSDSYTSKHQLELEYGLTDHLQLAAYVVWKWNERDSLFYDEWKAEVKYRFVEPGDWPVDVAVYAEYHGKNGSPPDDSDKVEIKLITSKSWGPWNVTSNMIAEKAVQNASKTSFDWTAAVSYAWTSHLRTSLEFKQTLGDQDEFGWHRKGHVVQLMPTIGWKMTSNSKILIGPAFGITRAAPDVEIKTMVAIEF